jgi:hypothetical protein
MSIHANTTIAKKVQQWGKWLIFLAITAIITLGIIIMRHLLRNQQLIANLKIAKGFLKGF